MPYPLPMTDSTLRLRVIPAIAEIDAAAWDACANPALAATAQPNSELPDQVEFITQDVPYNPFISYDFLHALEASGSATARAGWQPQHVLAEAADGAVLGAVPCYLKSHSRGEYVFDRGWAEAYERAGGALLPQAPGVGAVHAGDRPAAAGRAPRPTPTRCAMA